MYTLPNKNFLPSCIGNPALFISRYIYPGLEGNSAQDRALIDDCADMLVHHVRGVMNTACRARVVGDETLTTICFVWPEERLLLLVLLACAITHQSHVRSAVCSAPHSQQSLVDSPQRSMFAPNLPTPVCNLFSRVQARRDRPTPCPHR